MVTQPGFGLLFHDFFPASMDSLATYFGGLLYRLFSYLLIYWFVGVCLLNIILDNVCLKSCTNWQEELRDLKQLLILVLGYNLNWRNTLLDTPVKSGEEMYFFCVYK